MKKFIFAFFIALSFMSVTSQAQLITGRKAPDFTVTALNCNSQVVNLYAWLDSNKYVFVDVSATWCGPCWAYHNTKALETLFTEHGPGTTTDDVRVLFIEGDASTTDADMAGTGSNTQGNWLNGTLYPMCNPVSPLVNTIGADYEIKYFPTVYMICPDRTVRELTQPSAATMYSYITDIGCPEKITIDPAFSTIAGKLISANGDFSFNYTFKNRGFDTLKAATITVSDGTNILNTTPWTGSVATFGEVLKTIELKSVSVLVNKLCFEIIADGDQVSTNNYDTVSVNTYAPENALSLPYTLDFSSVSGFPVKFGYNDVGSLGKFGFIDGINGTTKVVGPSGSNIKSMFIPFFNLSKDVTGTMVIGNFNATSTSTQILMEFDVSYAQFDGTENDKIEVVVSTNSGSTWVSKWSKAGATLKTSAATTASFVPTSASQWRHETVDFSSIINQTNALVGLRITSAYGNYAFINNISIKEVTGTDGVTDMTNPQFDVYPNPASDFITISGFTGEASIVDVMGVEVWNGNVTDNGQVNVNTLSTGVYYIKFAGKTIRFVKM